MSVNKQINQLSRQIDLTGYQVTVVDCCIPNLLVFRNSSLTIHVYRNDSGTEEKTMLIQPPDLSDYHLVELLKKSIDGYAKVSVNSIGQLQIETLPDIRLVLSKPLARILGLQDTIIAGFAKSLHAVSVHLLTNQIVVLSNVVESFYCNGNHLPCLYQGPLVFHGNSLIYHKTLDIVVGTVFVRILNTANDQIDLPDGTFSLLLHFEKIPKH